eukprot:CAMPEP_0194118556 /NCGR_PEP_ID=MMETSP0150-20130528/36075_1 /TAXON_ID=122233 /ORGANISM="Chaetoceros debilis, Strain MM31A-1" /LENGTH=850 /DNA_ID=CAMNT_0038809981 /DNA_START=83 /DNA_END=2635 /DNA_ORIENTATION=-
MIPVPKELLAQKKKPCDSSAREPPLFPDDSFATALTADMCRCPHIDAYLPKYLDSKILGLDLNGESHSQNCFSTNKRQRKNRISDVHLESILPCNNINGNINSETKSTPTLPLKTNSVNNSGLPELYSPLHLASLDEDIDAKGGKDSIKERSYQQKQSRKHEMTDNILKSNQHDEDINRALLRVERWLEVIRENRLQYWRHQNTPLTTSKDPFSCNHCLKKTFSNRKIPRGDALMQCLDCSMVGCGPTSLSSDSYTRRHIQQHFLLSGHSFGITCGPKGEIFCMKCGDFVSHEIFSREIQLAIIEARIPWLSWDRRSRLQRSFGFGDENEDFILFPNDDRHDEDPSLVRENRVGWRGFRATYPDPIPDELISAARITLHRLRLFHGEAPINDAYLTLDASSSKLALQQRSRNLSQFWMFDCPVGIYNAGNICYISSVMQCIFNLRKVQQYFLLDVKHDHKACKILRSTPKKNGVKSVSCLACEMDRLMLRYYSSANGIAVCPLIDDAIDPSITANAIVDSGISCNAPDSHATITSHIQSQKGMPVNPSDFLVAAWKSNDMLHLAGNEQHDAHEFLQAYLGIIDKDCKRFRKSITKPLDTNIPGTIKSILPDPTNDSLNNLDSLSSLFEGSLRSVLMCDECGYKRSHLEPFLNVSLSLPTAKSTETSRTGNRRRSLRIDVQTCIDNFTAAEPLSDSLVCSWCKTKTCHYTQHTFSKLPEILCLHLKRFDAASNKKIDEPVSFPSTLDMGSYLPHWREIEQIQVKSSSGLGKPTTKLKQEMPTVYPAKLYDLCGTINHSGTLNQGHYVSNVKIDKGWFICNDEQINKVSKEDSEKVVVKSEEVYMMFYSRRT